MPSANDWASPDPSKNMTLAEAEKFVNQLAGALTLQIANRYVRTTTGQIVPEEDLRANNFMSPLPVNLMGHLASSTYEFNLAEFRITLRKAAVADEPTGTLVNILQQILGQNANVAALFTRIPAVQDVIAASLKKL